MYYEGGISSVYLWEDANEVFVACFLIKKDGSKSGHGRRGYLHDGIWDAIHVIEVAPEDEEMTRYCLTSTVMLSLTTTNDSSGTFNLSGSIRRQVYFGKTKEMVCNLRPPSELLQMRLPDN
ncbi:hypothetical protein CsSME_00035297 [Camellia sinensis var. sinensis]